MLLRTLAIAAVLAGASLATPTLAHDDARTKAVDGWKAKVVRRVSRDMTYSTPLLLPDGGVVVMALTVDRDGRILDHDIARSSGRDILDKSAQRLVRHLHRFPALPDAIKGDTVDVQLHLAYEIEPVGTRIRPHRTGTTEIEDLARAEHGPVALTIMADN